MKIKYLLFLSVLILFSASASSAPYKITTNSVDYGGGEIEVECTGSCTMGYAYVYQFEMCGEVVDSGVSDFSFQNRFVGSPQGYTLQNPVPEHFSSCSLGEHDVTFRIRKIDATSNPNPIVSSETKIISVTSQMSDPNKGYYIVSRLNVRTDPTKDSRARDFFLTNEAWYDDDTIPNEFPDLNSGSRGLPKGAAFMISEADTGIAPNRGDNGVYVAQYGNIIRPKDESLGDHVLSRYTTALGGPPEGWQVSGGDPVAHIEQALNRDFDQNYVREYGKNGNGGCHVFEDGTFGGAGYEWNGNCAPLHNDGVYEPQGEIIVASEPSATFANTGDPLSRTDTTHFYVCRTDYKGTKPSNSKVVKVQEASRGVMVDNWKYYRCNQANDWQRIECPPGQEVERRSGKLQCVNKDPVTVDVKFFNVSGVPQKSSGDSVIAGFKVESSEISKYEDFMGSELKQVDAECWMGDDDQRPGTSGTGTFRLNYDGSGDAWVLGEIPYRAGVSENTYSCAWGFSQKKASPKDESIYASTRKEPFKSVEGSRPNIDYSTLRNEYISYGATELDEGVSRSGLWTPYSTGDTRPYVDKTETDMFRYNGAFSYCETPLPPSASSAILDNIECSASNKAPIAIATASASPSLSSLNAGDKVVFDSSASFDNDGSISSYNWEFGDGSSATGKMAQHSFSSRGTYEVVLTVTDDDGASKSDLVQITVGDPSRPTAVADASSTRVEKGETVDFDASSSTDDGYITSYEWDFKDGESATGESVQHSFSSAGDYDVQLKVTDNDGKTSTDTVTVEVETAIGESDKLEIAYLPSGFSGAGEPSVYNDKVDSSHSLLAKELPVSSDKVEKNVVQPNQCDVTCNMKDPYTCNQWSELEDECIGSSNVIEKTEFDIVHVICDDRSDECTGPGGNLAGRVNAIGGRLGTTMLFDTSDNIADTVVHEIGHNLELRHVFNEEMLYSSPTGTDWDFGDTFDPSTTDPSIGACISIPGDYTDDVGGGMKKIDDITSSSKNFADNSEGSDAINFFMSYCGPEERYGPAAKTYMNNNPLSGY